ncbi:MAG: BBP7 family outer membrane beta-barrel protein, partial [Candidatus Marinimicrobia bacterium]|nr:BBP7 family outer membrane beta-barrel protein [Candidatus Neomarinimicrobiota bacterium]
MQEVEMEWVGGFEARIGHFFNLGQNAWEIVYWGIFPFQQESVLIDVNVNGALNAILNFDQLSINVGGVPTVVGDWVDNADAHRLRRDFDIHNVEFNVWNYTGCSAVGCRSRITYNWGFGGRYFRVDEKLQFSAKENGTGIVFDDSTNQINYDVDVDNNLIGAQIIGNGQYFLNNCLSFSVGTKVGVYANVINHRSRIYNIDGTAFVNNGPNNGAEFDVTSNKTDVALMAELNVGFNYQFNQRWNAYSGYRALGITSLATATGQIPRDLRGVQDVQIIDSNDGVLLH